MPAFNPDTTPIANASDHSFKGDRTRLYLFRFGAYGDCYVYAWGNDGFDDALEEAAGWLADNAPGHFHEPDYQEAADDLGYPADWAEDSDMSGRVAEHAEADLTYTESGYLASWEWAANAVNDPDVVAYIRWRSQEGEDPDDPSYREAEPDAGAPDCIGVVGRAYYPAWWGPAYGYHGVNGAPDNDTGADYSYDCNG